jgi:glutathione S-transferase
MLTLYDYLDSGNGYKIRLLLAQLDRPYRWVELDIMQGRTRTPEFLAKNPNGRIPTVELDGGEFLAESNAILWYFAEGTPFYVATPRFIIKHLPPDSPRQAEVPKRLEQGRAALAVMDTHLKQHPFFAGGRYTIADITLYAYTHVAHEATLDLTPYANVRAWMERVASQPRHIPITYRPGS